MLELRLSRAALSRQRVEERRRLYVLPQLYAQRGEVAAHAQGERRPMRILMSVLLGEHRAGRAGAQS